MGELKIYLRHEELPVVAEFLKHSFLRDKHDFEAYSPIFGGGFIVDYQKRLDAAKTILHSEVLTKDLKMVTESLYTNIEGLKKMLTRVSGYIRLAGGSLAINPKDFGIKELREEIRRKDVEALLERLKIVMKHIENNQKVLGGYGFKPDMLEIIAEKHDKIENDNLQQDVKLKERQQLVIDNTIVLKELWKSMQTITNTGKAIYQYECQKKVNDYTMAALRRKLRHEKKHAHKVGSQKNGG